MQFPIDEAIFHILNTISVQNGKKKSENKNSIGVFLSFQCFDNDTESTKC